MSVGALSSATLALDENKVTPGIAGFLVVFVLGLATWLLIRSMTKQIRKVDFEEKDTERPHHHEHGDDHSEGSAPTV